MPDEAPPPPSAGAGTTPSPPETEAPKEDWESRFKYLLADFENYRRRVAKERDVASRQARAALLRELLPLVEAFRSAREAADPLPASDPLRKGLELLDREWTTFLRHEGVEPVAERGQPFRADEAEAVGDAPTEDTVPEGTVAEIVQQGYRFFGGLLRPAKVIVARARKPDRSDDERVPGGERPEAES